MEGDDTTEPPRPNPFKFTRATIVVMILAAIGMMCVNLIPQSANCTDKEIDDFDARARENIRPKIGDRNLHFWDSYAVWSFGWPLPGVTLNWFEWHCSESPNLSQREFTYRVSSVFLILDFIVVVSMVVAIGYVFQWSMPRIKRFKLQRIQIHLSTAIAMMFVGGGLLAVNLCHPVLRPGGSNAEFEIYGFPMSFEKYIHYGIGKVDATEWQTNDSDFLKAVGIDIAVLITICIVVAVLCEWHIRRRTKKIEAK